MTIVRTRDGVPIRAHFVTETGRFGLIVEARDGRLEGYYEDADGRCGALLDTRAWEHFAKLALGRLRMARFVIDQAVEERKAFRVAHRDFEPEPEVQEIGLRFAGALDKFHREAGAGQPFTERWAR